VVVDEDIDVTDTDAVLWAMATRSDPAADIDIMRNTWSTPLDPLLFEAPYSNNRALVDACRPWQHRKDFPPVAEASAELKARIREKYAHVLNRK
jgi:4-hydroxy-3-polyprenylbenzoate decarboxylase